MDLSRNPRHGGLFIRPPEEVALGLPRYGIYGAYGGLTTTPLGIAPTLDQYYATPQLYGQTIVGSPIIRTPYIQTPALGMTGGFYGGHMKHVIQKIARKI